jgi:hypothetical protein
MPFTLAHPAAILPLRGGRYLRTMPLILGALVPDTRYYVPGEVARYFAVPETHSFVGSFTSCLLLGYAALIVVYQLRRPLTALLSARARWLYLTAIAPFKRPREWLLAPVAIVVGAWTHLLWDSATHPEGWIVHRVAALSAPVTIGSYTGQVCHLLQYVSSVFGLVVLVVWYWRLSPAPPRTVRDAHATRSLAGPVLLLVVAAAILIGSVQATEYYGHYHNVYRTLNILLTRSLAWFGALYLIAGTIVTLEQTHGGGQPST